MPKTVTPIMSRAEERFTAFISVQQWALAVVDRRNDLRQLASDMLSKDLRRVRHGSIPHHVVCLWRTQSKATDFCNSVILLHDFVVWSRTFGDFSSIISTEFNALKWNEIRDVRNMRVHVGEYFQGKGNNPDRWFDQRLNTGADASSIMNTRIGNRVDYEEIGSIVENMLEPMFNEEVPYPPMP